MTSQLARLYALVSAVLVFFLAWAAVAAHPWAPQAGTDPQTRGARGTSAANCSVDSLRVKQIVDRRWATYRSELASRTHSRPECAATPSVRVVNLPPLVVTRTS